jgi:hypothetical protein
LLGRRVRARAGAYASLLDTGNAVGDALWSRALRAAVDRGWNAPEIWHSVVVRVHDPFDGLQIRYLLHPWDAGQTRPPVSAAWRRSQSARLAAWIDGLRAPVGVAFRGRAGTRADIALPEPEDTPESDAPTAEASGTAALRALTSRAATGAAEFGATWFFLGNAATATAVTALRFGAHAASALTHDWAWDWTAPRPVPGPPIPPLGTESPLPR